MFRNFVATATTLVVVASLSFTGISSAAAATDPTNPSTSAPAVTDAPSADATPSDPATAPADPPAPSAPVTSAPALQQESTDPAPAQIADDPAVCIPNSAVNYSYAPATNSGDITVNDVANSTGVLCAPFWVTATSWRYMSETAWPQVRDRVDKLPKISTPGTYHFAAAVTCGQGDIYASATTQPDPTDYLTSPGKPFHEEFLLDMGFNGPWPTYTGDSPSCNVVTPVVPTATSITRCGTYGSISVPADSDSVTYTVTGSGLQGRYVVTAKVVSPYTLAEGAATTWTFELGEHTICAVDATVTPADPSAAPEVCSDGATTAGSIFVELQDGLVFSIVSVDGTSKSAPTISIPVVTQHETKLPAGNYLVSVVAKPGFVLDQTENWPFALTVAPASECGGLPTFSVQPIDVTTTSAVCKSNGSNSATGTITVGQVQGVDFTPYVRYSIDGVLVTSISTAVSPGTHRVTAVAAIAGDALKDGPNVLEDGTAAWTVTIAAGAALCADLKTLALPVDSLATTGTDATPWLVVALALLILGAALVIVQRRIARRRQLPHRSH